MMPRRNFLVGAAVAVGAAGLWAGLRGIRPPPRLRVGYVPLADCAPLVKAQQDGVYSRLGLEVELTVLQSGARILEAIAAKSLDVGISNLVTLMMARSRGIDYQVVSGASLERKLQPLHAILAREDSPILRFADLRGRRVAVNVMRSVNELVMSSLAEKSGFSISDINFVEIPFPQMIGVLQNKTVDAMVAIEPYVSRAVKQFNARVLTHHIVDEFGDTPVAAYVADQRETSRLAPALRLFRQAVEEASNSLNAEMTVARSFIAEFTKLPPDLVNQMNLPLFTTRLPDSVAPKMAEMMLKYRWITEEQKRSILTNLVFAE